MKWLAWPLVALAVILLTVAMGQIDHLWWVQFLPALVVSALYARRGAQGFWLGFVGVAAAWAFQALRAHLGNDGILTGQMAQVLSAFTLGSPLVLILVTVLLGGLLGGLAGLSGRKLRWALWP